MTEKSKVIPASPSAEEFAKSAAASPDDAALFAKTDPFALFHDWFEEAKKREPSDANAMALATADAHGAPDVRMVLLKDVSPAGFVFYSNAESRKGQQLAANAQAAVVFHWKSLRRQVRASGDIALATIEEADTYFATRAKDSQIGAWASDQSRPMEGRFELEKRIARYAAKFALGKTPRPQHWTGWRLAPRRIEFWRDRPFRLHDRLEFTRVDVSTPWTTQRLFP